MEHFNARWKLAPTLLVGASGGGLAYATDLPLPWLLGAMLLTTVLSLMNVRLATPRLSRKVVLVVLGVMLGSAFTPSLAGNLGDWIVSLAIMLTGTAVMTGVSVWLSYRVGGNSLTTAVYAGLPGGVSTVTLLAADSDADLRIVGLTHAVRILVLLLAIPLVLDTLGQVNLAPDTGSLGQWLAIPAIGESMILIGAGLGGALLGFCLRLPNPLLFGPVCVSAVLHITGLSEATIPPAIVALAQIIIGVSIGVRFLGTSWSSMRRNLTVSVFQALVLILIAAAAAWLGHVMTGYSPAATLLAYVPGGAPELSLVALSLGIEPAFVTSHHLLRISVLILTIPLLVAGLGKGKRKRKRGSTAG